MVCTEVRKKCLGKDIRCEGELKTAVVHRDSDRTYTKLNNHATVDIIDGV